MINEPLEKFNINNWTLDQPDNIEKYKTENKSVLLKFEDLYIAILNGGLLAIGEKQSDQSWSRVDYDISEKLENNNCKLYIPPNDEILILLGFNILGYTTLDDELYTNNQEIKDLDDKLQKKDFTGFIEISENTISGNHYIMYYNGSRYNLTTKNEEFIIGDKSHSMCLSHVGIYELNKITINYSIKIDKIIEKTNTDIDKNNHKSPNTDDSFIRNNNDVDKNTKNEDTDEDIGESVDNNDGYVKQLDEKIRSSENTENDEEKTEIESGKNNVNNQNIQNLDDKLDKILNKLNNIEETISKKDDSVINDKNSKNQITKSRAIKNTKIKVRYPIDTKTLSKAKKDEDIQKSVENMNFVVQSTLNDKTVDDQEYKEFIKNSDIYNFINWIFKDMYMRLIDSKSPNIPGLVSMMSEMEGLHCNARTNVGDYNKSDLYDSVIYESSGEPRGVISIFDENKNVKFNDINSIIEDLKPTSSNISDTLNILIISKGTYSTEIKSKIDDIVSNGTLLRRQDKDGLIKAENGGLINICLFEKNIDDEYVMVYPRS